MSIAVTCPQCRLDFEVPPELADTRVRCLRCAFAFKAEARPAREDGIQVGATPRPRLRDDDEMPRPSPPRPTAHAPFPWGPIAIVTIGILFLLLSFSVGFNLWLAMVPDNRRIALVEAMDAQQVAMEERMRADQARQMALAQQAEAEVKLARMQADLAIARKQLDDANDELANGDGKDAAWGSLEGRVTWKGPLPKVESIEDLVKQSPNKEHLLNGPKELLLNPTWQIDPKTLGVANVCVFINRPKDGILPIHPADKVRKAPAVIDAPFLVFTPHVVGVYPEWFDGKNRGATGEKLNFKNSSKAAFSARGLGNGIDNPGFNLVVPPGLSAQPDLRPQKQPIQMVCSLHVWMSAYAFVFDHPYFAVTKADGTFTIPRVPAGMEVRVMAWHEEQGWLLTKDGRAMTLKAGKNTLDFEMSAK